MTSLAYLDNLVPASRDNDGVLGVGAEADARNPLGVALVGDGVLAVAKSVPELDGPVARARDNLAVVGREGHRQNVVGVANKVAGRLSGGKLPQAKSLVPGRGESVCAIRGDDTVGHNVVVAVQGSLRIAVVAAILAGQVPDDQSLVTRGRQEHVGAVRLHVLA